VGNSIKEGLIAALLKHVKELKFKNRNDLFQATKISLLIFEELQKLRRKYRKNFSARSKLSKRIIAAEEAEEEIILDIARLLNEKMAIFIMSNLDK
jgi:ferredoxin-fold anticodon binding domain-containing protein